MGGSRDGLRAVVRGPSRETLVTADYSDIHRRARAAGVKPIGIIGTDDLNECAERFGKRQIWLSRRPVEPTFWFYTLALDAKVWSWGPKLLALLSPAAKTLLDLVNLEEYTTWCVCCDRALGMAHFNAKTLHASGYVECWPCLFDCHDLCSHDCKEADVMITFPEKIMQRRIGA